MKRLEEKTEKMRTATLGILISAAVWVSGLTGCTSVTDGPVDGDGEDGGPTMISISIPDAVSYADNNATDAEALFKTADVFIFGSALEKHVHLLNSDFTYIPGASGAPSRYELQTPFEVNSGLKRIFVGINLSGKAVEAVKNGYQSVYSYPVPALPTVQTVLRDSIARGGTNGFAMFNVKDSVYTVLPGVDDPQTESKNEFVIEVSRWVAKTTMRKASDLNNVASGATFLINDVGGLSFCMGNVNTKMYPLQKKLAVGDSIVDPNFASNYSLYGAEMVNDFGGNYPNIVATAYVDVNNDGAAISARNNKYTVENTSREPYLRGLMSYISVRARFTPNAVVSTYDPLLGLATSTPNSAVINNLNVYIKANGEYIYFGGTEVADMWAAHPANLGNTYLGRYRNGYCYYMVYLDPKTSYSLSPYASIRNFFYDTRITKISALGYPDPEEPNPTEPLATQMTITVDVSIKDWTIVMTTVNPGDV